MMLLAQAVADQPALAAQAGGVTARMGFFDLPESWPMVSDLARWCAEMRPGTAAILIAAGIAFLLFGFTFVRVLMALNIAILFAWLGGWLGSHAQSGLAGAIIGGFAGAAISWPFQKGSVVAVAGMVGFALGASVWHAIVGETLWASGGITGAVFLSMLALVNYRLTIILATGIQGAFMIIMGLLAILYQYQELTTRLDSALGAHVLVMPMLILVPAVLGIIYQNAAGGSAAPAKK